MFDDEPSEEEIHVMVDETLDKLVPGYIYSISELFPDQDDYLFEIHEALLDEIEDRGWAVVPVPGFRGCSENTPWRLYRSPDGVDIGALGEMEAFAFESGGFFQGFWEIELDLARGCICRITEPFESEPKEIFLTDLQMQAIKDVIFDSGALDWKRRYTSDVLDGAGWGLEIRFSGGYVKRSDGNNVWPEGYDVLEAVLVPLGFERERA